MQNKQKELEESNEYGKKIKLEIKLVVVIKEGKK